jgi:hypothetical protein
MKNNINQRIFQVIDTFNEEVNKNKNSSNRCGY